MESVIKGSNENPGQIQILQKLTHNFNRYSANYASTHIDSINHIFHVTDWSSLYIQVRTRLIKLYGGIAYG